MRLSLLLEPQLLGGDSPPTLLSSSVNSEKVRASFSRIVVAVMEQLLAPRGDRAPPLLRPNRMPDLREG